MTDINLQLLQLILEGKSTSEISKTLNISPKQLKIRLEALKMNGYNFEYQISDDGIVKYNILSSLFQNYSNTVNLKLVKKPNELSAIVVSDFHIGHRLECPERINLIYEYAKKDGINIIINCGDLIDGCCNKEEEQIVIKQIEKLIKTHPYDEDILNLVCFGNHDYSALEHYGINIANILCANRLDFISLGFGTSLINIHKSQIMISHPVKHESHRQNHRWPSDWIERKLILKGHGHHNSIKAANKKCIIKVPTLSNILYSQNSSVPGAIKLTILLNQNGLFETLYIKNLMVTDKVYTTGYFKYTFSGNNSELKEEKILTKKYKNII